MMMRSLLTAKDVARFWSYVEKTDGCWIWRGSVCALRGGYGQINIRGKVLKTHRVAYALEIAEVPDGLFVCHHCDNPICVRPSHLFVGTCADNVNDAWKKGRLPLPKDAPIGESHHSAKLSSADVIDAREAHKKGSRNNDLAKKYGVTPTAMSNLLRGKTWKSV